jgi:hypothetical protein
VKFLRSLLEGGRQERENRRQEETANNVTVDNIKCIHQIGGSI